MSWELKMTIEIGDHVLERDDVIENLITIGITRYEKETGPPTRRGTIEFEHTPNFTVLFCTGVKDPDLFMKSLKKQAEIMNMYKDNFQLSVVEERRRIEN